MPDFDDELVGVILAASRAMVSIAAAALEASPIELTLVQYRGLVVLALEGPQPMSAFGAAMNLSPSSATRMVDRLARKDLVERQASPTSRRVIDLHLTDLGREVVDVVMAFRKREIEAIVAKVPKAGRQRLRVALADFALAAGEPVGPGWPEGALGTPGRPVPAR